MQLVIRLDGEPFEALSQRKHNWYAESWARSKAIDRVRRHWLRINPPRVISMGSLKRRYHASNQHSSWRNQHITLFDFAVSRFVAGLMCSFMMAGVRVPLGQCGLAAVGNLPASEEVRKVG